MSDPGVILARCLKLGLRVWADGDRIGIAPSERIPPDLLDAIRDAKPALLPLMREGKAHRLTADCIPWLYVARQVLAGEFDGCDRSTRESLVIGLRSVLHPIAQRALERLRVDRSKTNLP